VSERIPAGQAPRITVVVRDCETELLLAGVLPSLATGHQQGVDADLYEIVVVRGKRASELSADLGSLAASARTIDVVEPEQWLAAGADAALGESIFFVGAPGIASPTMIASLSAACDLYPETAIAVATLAREGIGARDGEAWFRDLGWPYDPFSLVRGANLENDWLEPLTRPANVLLPRRRVETLLDAGRLTADGVRDAWTELPGPRTQLVGDAFVLPEAPAGHTGSGTAVDVGLSYFGLVTRPRTATVIRPPWFVRRERPRLSVVLVVHDMRREAPRSVRSLLPPHQRDIDLDDYEIIVVENGSTDPLSEREVLSLAPNVSYTSLANPLPSPARAINHGVGQARGDVVAIMIDGACLVSPGALATGLRAFRAFPSPVVAMRYFHLGPGSQRQTMLEGYDTKAEDRLLEGIEWPRDGYRLFEVASPLTFGGTTEHWFTAWFESNCLILSREVFDGIGGCDERFDFPGGGHLNLDLFRRASDLPDTQPVQLIGEGVFHQIHGGITTNTSDDDADAKKSMYEEQYVRLRGVPAETPPKSFYFFGALSSPACRWKMRG
jgi:hypothetical protein